jgi:hypothetical protein
MKSNYWKIIGIPLIVAARLILPFLLWWNALVGTILVLLADLADGEVFRRAFAFQKNNKYQRIDKGLDFYWYVFALIYSTRFSFFNALLFFFLFRALGTILFFLKKDRKFLVLFPNIFENLFIFYIVIYTFPSLPISVKTGLSSLDLLISTGLKMIQEYILHFRQFQFCELFTGKRWV